jgi:hypothetical protein
MRSWLVLELLPSVDMPLSVYDRAHPPKTFDVFARQFADLV